MLSGLKLGRRRDCSEDDNDFVNTSASPNDFQSKVATTPNDTARTFDGESSVSSTSPTGWHCLPQPLMVETGRAIDPKAARSSTRCCVYDDDSWSCWCDSPSSQPPSSSSQEEDDAFFKNFWTIGSQHTTESCTQKLGGFKRSFAAEFSGADEVPPSDSGIVPLSECVTTTTSTAVAHRKRACRVR